MGLVINLILCRLQLGSTTQPEPHPILYGLGQLNLQFGLGWDRKMSTQIKFPNLIICSYKFKIIYMYVYYLNFFNSYF